MKKSCLVAVIAVLAAVAGGGGGGFYDYHRCRHKRQLEHYMENLTGGNPPVRPLPCVVPCKLYFVIE